MSTDQIISNPIILEELALALGPIIPVPTQSKLLWFSQLNAGTFTNVNSIQWIGPVPITGAISGQVVQCNVSMSLYSTSTNNQQVEFQITTSPALLTPCFLFASLQGNGAGPTNPNHQTLSFNMWFTAPANSFTINGILTTGDSATTLNKTNDDYLTFNIIQTEYKP